MKTLFFPLVALLFAFFIGCQSSITDPIVTDNSYSANKDFISTLTEVTKLQGTVDDPRQSFNSSVDINGEIRYLIETVYFDSPPPAPQSAFKVRLYVDAQLKANCGVDDEVWKVNNVSEDLVYNIGPAESDYFLQKSFRVQSTCPTPLDLVLNFKVDEKELKIVAMNLKIADNWVPPIH